ncbi:hypothetical protein KR767_01840 [Luteibacter anthropi]|nr:hypothetical protein [Luteibacter anthropi]URX62837.1 hypothetical protein KR767_01840 [Luteibacter anthropi]
MSPRSHAVLKSGSNPFAQTEDPAIAGQVQADMMQSAVAARQASVRD